MSKKTDSIIIGGRTFKAVADSTMAHDTWMIREARKAGLSQFIKQEDESADDFAQRILGLVIDSGNEFLLLGGLLIPYDKDPCDWTPELAQGTAAFLAAQSDPRDKATISGQIASMLLGFFASGLASATTSQLSSGDAPNDEPEIPDRIEDR